MCVHAAFAPVAAAGARETRAGEDTLDCLHSGFFVGFRVVAAAAEAAAGGRRQFFSFLLVFRLAACGGARVVFYC